MIGSALWSVPATAQGGNTALTGQYRFTLRTIYDSPRDVDERVVHFSTEAFGLELKTAKYTGSTLVIEHIERPSPT